MEKRRFDKLGIETSLLGFGCMRFPLLEDGKIDEKEAEAMLDLAIENGVNYIDTAYPYHNGDSEPFVGRVLDKYDRNSYYLATKLPTWLIHSKEDAEKIFEEQLKRLHKDYVDFYLLHSLDLEGWHKLRDLGIVELCEQWKEQGRIRYLGFSFHDSYQAFEEIITYRAWDFCQIQFNYMDTEEQAGLKGYELAKQLDIPMVIMEPVRGGALAGFSPDIDEVFHKLDPSASVASYALRWVGSFPNVKVILSGMSTKEQVEDNLKTFRSFRPLEEEENKAISSVVQTLKGRIKNGCTGCAYCMPCPSGVNIPKNFKLWNTYAVYQKYGMVKGGWEELKEKGSGADCIQCGKCEQICPQKLPIRTHLAELKMELDRAGENP